MTAPTTLCSVSDHSLAADEVEGLAARGEISQLAAAGKLALLHARVELIPWREHARQEASALAGRLRAAAERLAPGHDPLDALDAAVES